MPEQAPGLLDRITRGRAGPYRHERVRWAALAGALTAALGLVAASVASGQEAGWWTWITYAGCSATGLAAIVIFASAFVDRPRAVAVGSAVYLLPVLLFLAPVAADGQLLSDGLDRLAAGLMWPNWAVQAWLACPLGLPCPVGR